MRLTKYGTQRTFICSKMYLYIILKFSDVNYQGHTNLSKCTIYICCAVSERRAMPNDGKRYFIYLMILRWKHLVM